MKKCFQRFPQRTVNKIVKIMNRSKSIEETRNTLFKTFQLNQQQIDFIMTFSPDGLSREIYNGFSPYHDFIHVLSILEFKEPVDRCAVIVNKVFGRLDVYEKAVCETKPGDSYFRFLDSKNQNGCLRLTFTNNGTDRYYLDVYSPQEITENEVEMRIKKASQVIYNGIWWGKDYEKVTFTITYEMKEYIVVETTSLKGETKIHRY